MLACRAEVANFSQYQALLDMKSLYLPSPTSITIWWNGGIILSVLLIIQIVTGFFLAMHYVADVPMAFSSVIHIVRDVPGGWFFRSIHANGASFFFFFMYLHIGRGIYYKSFQTQPKTWLVGVTLLVFSMATAFCGYVLPWGQMSFWGATVITNLLSAIPVLGGQVVEWVWGGFCVGQPTLSRFFGLHFILPFAIAFLSLLHLFFLHEKGSTSPLGSLTHTSKVVFHPYFTWKDLVGIFFLFLGLGIVSLLFPFFLGDPENFTCANPMVTPTHIQPEWYFLFAYAILRSIPSKLGGVLALVMAVGVLYLLPWKGPSTFWPLAATFLLLTWLGGCVIEEPYVTCAQVLSLLYFLLFFLC